MIPKQYVTTPEMLQANRLIEATCCLQNPDFEYVQLPPACINDTWHYVIVVYGNGAIISQDTVDSGLPCNGPAPVPIDIEVKDVDRCDPATGTIWRKCVAFHLTDPQDVGSLVQVDIVPEYDTGIVCNQTDPIDIPLCEPN